MTLDRHDRMLDRAQQGDAEAFGQLTEPHRRALHLHCYRIVGSIHDAEDLVQETLATAWRSLDGFDRRASLRVWLYRIATNKCLDALRARDRRPREVAPMTDVHPPTRSGEPLFVQPYPDVLLEGVGDEASGPEARVERREAVSLAFVGGLQRLVPAQRAVLVLRDVLGLRAAEVAEILGSTETAVNGLLLRARKALEDRAPASPDRLSLPDDREERLLLGRFADAVESGDAQQLAALLTADAWLTMPPQPVEYQGPASIAAFLQDRWDRWPHPAQIVWTRANGQPAFAMYVPDPQAGIAHGYGLGVLSLEGAAISAVTYFMDPSLLAAFGLPRTVPHEPA